MMPTIRSLIAVVSLTLIATCNVSARQFDWTKTNPTWDLQRVRTVVDTAKGFLDSEKQQVRRNNFPFPDTITLPGQIVSVSKKASYSLVTAQIYSTKGGERSSSAGMVSGADPYDERSGVSIDTNDAVEITIKVPANLGRRHRMPSEKKILYLRDGAFFLQGKDSEFSHIEYYSGFSGNMNFVFDRKARELVAIEIGEHKIRSGSYADTRVNASGRWASFRRLFRDHERPSLWRSEEGWYRSEMPADVSANMVVGGVPIQFPANIGNKVWYFKAKDEPWDGWNSYHPGFVAWVTPSGVTLYVTKMEGDRGASGLDASTVTSSTSASETFDD